jgi:phosphoglycolate phosphatase
MRGGEEMRHAKAIFFDLDGTLLDSLPGIAYSAQAAFAECGLAQREVDLRGLIGPPIRTILARMSQGATEGELDALEHAFRASYDSEGWNKTPHYAGAGEALLALKAQGKRLFIVSNKPRHISVRILETEGTLALFDEVVTRDTRDPPYRDKLEMLVRLLRKWEIAAGDCLMVGDTIEDAEAASEAGMQFCLMTHGYGDVPLDSSVPVTFRFDHFSELMPGPAEEQSH